METCLCSFKKIFRIKHGRYLGYYLDRQADEIEKAQSDNWQGIDWNVLWQSRTESLNPNLIIKSNKDSLWVNKDRFSEFSNNNTLKHLDWMFPDETTIADPIKEFTMDDFFA